jgi:PAS domain S-box-containing protein
MPNPGIKHFRILVADDNKATLDKYRKALSRVKTDHPAHPETVKFKFDLVLCRQGDEAVQAVEKSLEEDRSFSVAFMDFRMLPGPDGVSSAEQIRALDPDIEIVIVTGYADVHPRDIVRRVPPAHKMLYIRKPFEAQKIFHFASALSMKWHTACELQKTHEELKNRIGDETQDLNKANERLDGIIKSITDNMSIIDEDLNIVWVNDVGKKLFGKNIVGKKCYQVYHRRKKPCRQCIVQETFADGNTREQELEVIGKDGNKIVFWSTASVAERHQDGRPKLVAEISRDVTERKQAIENLMEAHNKLELELAKVNKEIIETNQALFVLAKNIDKKKIELEKKVNETITTKIMPILKDLRTEEKLVKYLPEINSVAEYLNGISSETNVYYDAISRLTHKEMKVAAMIKNGMTTREIAGLMFISEETVKVHRKNIRKKMNIQNTNHRLSSYLASMMGKD